MDIWTSIIANTFSSDEAWMFIDSEVRRHVQAIQDIFADEQRFRLDEDAVGELIPRIEILLFLCDCGGVLDEDLDLANWKVRYLDMYNDQIDGHTYDDEYKEEYKRKRRAVIVDTFDRLIEKQKEQWQDDQDDTE